jgi:Holliday junction resolvase RusA-like endonuclease
VGYWRELVAYSVAQSWRTGPLEGPIRVRLSFVMPRPAATPKRRTPPAIKRPDIDKLTRAVNDALSGICWRDDSQVVDQHATKRLAERDEVSGVLIQIAPVEIGRAA